MCLCLIKKVVLWKENQSFSFTIRYLLLREEILLGNETRYVQTNEDNKVNPPIELWIIRGNLIGKTKDNETDVRDGW